MTQKYAIAESPSGVGIVAPVDYILVSNGDGTWNVAPQGGGGGAVNSVFTRTGDVVAEFNDYGTNLIANQSTSFSGTTLTTVIDNIAAAINNVLPAISSADNGKLLQVVGGVWAKQLVFPFNQFSVNLLDDPFTIDSPPGTVISPILPAGLYLVSMATSNTNSNANGSFSVQVGTVDLQGNTTMRTIIPSQLTTSNLGNTGSVILESDGTTGLRLAETEIVPLVGAVGIRFNISVTRLKGPFV